MNWDLHSLRLLFSFPLKKSTSASDSALHHFLLLEELCFLKQTLYSYSVVVSTSQAEGCVFQSQPLCQFSSLQLLAVLARLQPLWPPATVQQRAHIRRVCAVACLSVWPLGFAPATLTLSAGGLEPTLQIPMETDKRQQQQQQQRLPSMRLLSATLLCIFSPCILCV